MSDIRGVGVNVTQAAFLLKRQIEQQGITFYGKTESYRPGLPGMFRLSRILLLVLLLFFNRSETRQSVFFPPYAGLIGFLALYCIEPKKNCDPERPFLL